jgi:sulfopyruvate decarboxylase subunit beta
MKRFDCLNTLVPQIGDTVVITNIGGVAIEWQHLHDNDSTFYMWHSLGLATSIAFGMALSWPERQFLVFEGDGSLLMNLGGLATVAEKAPKNLTIVVFDNQAHESPGGYRTATAGRADLAAAALALGFPTAGTVETVDAFQRSVTAALGEDRLSMVVAKVQTGTQNVPLPAMDARENKYRFVRWVEHTRGITIIPRPGHVSKMRQES